VQNVIEKEDPETYFVGKSVRFERLSLFLFLESICELMRRRMSTEELLCRWAGAAVCCLNEKPQDRDRMRDLVPLIQDTFKTTNCLHGKLMLQSLARAV
jgi:hypothetical protein